MALSDQEKADVRYFLGYPDSKTNFAYMGGSVVFYEATLIINAALSDLAETAENQVRRIMNTLREIESQIETVRKRRKADKVGEIELNRREGAQLEAECRRWGYRLAELIGCQPNEQSERYGGLGVNTRMSF